MTSESAKRVAQKVIEAVSNGERPNKGKIIREAGYSENSAKTPQVVTRTKSYQSVIDGFVSKLEEEREAALRRMGSVRGKAKYRDLTDAVDKLTKNIQLLTGGDTGKVKIDISSVLDELEAE